MQKKSFFVYSEYEIFLDHLKNCGKVVPLGSWNGENSIILRHDVDLDIFPALRMAEIEAKHQIKSSYFILTTGIYNPCSAENRKMLKEIISIGAEIGLHFDTSIYRDQDLKSEFERECELLENIIGKKINSYSFHNPSVNNKYPNIDTDLRNAYDHRIFKEGCYLSDSRMDFHGVDPYSFAERVNTKTIQILLHPLHYSDDGGLYPEIFYRYSERFIDNVDQLFRVNSKYSELLPGTLFHSLVKRNSNI